MSTNSDPVNERKIMTFPLSTAEIGIYALAESKSRSNIVPHYTFDVNYLRDPIGHQAFNGLDGRYVRVQDWLKADKRVASILNEVRRLVYDHSVICKSKWTSFAFEDYHGKWISAALAEIVGQDLLAHQYKVGVVHSWI